MSDLSDVDTGPNVSPALEPRDFIPESDMESDPGHDESSSDIITTPLRVAAAQSNRLGKRPQSDLSSPDSDESTNNGSILQSEIHMLKEAVCEMRDALKQLVGQKESKLDPDPSTTSDSSIYTTPKRTRLSSKLRVSHNTHSTVLPCMCNVIISKRSEKRMH